jgi:hypothetical protein
MPTPKVQAKFIEPMLLLRSESLPDGDAWLYASALGKNDPFLLG